MSTVVVVTPNDDLLETVVKHLDTTASDLSNQIVVFPGQRPAHFLRKKLAERCGTSYRPPHILSIDHFVEELVRSSEGGMQESLTPLDAAALLYTIHKTFHDALGGSAFRTFSQFLPLGFMLYAEFEEVVMANVRPEIFLAAMEAVPYGRMQTVGRYFEAFYAEVEKRGKTTRALTYRRAAAIAQTELLNKYQRIIIAGFHALTNVEQQLFQALRQKEQTVFIYQRTEEESVSPAEEKNTGKFLSSIPALTITKAPDVHGQMFALAHVLRSQTSQPDETSVVVLPDSQALFPFLHHVIPALNGAEYNIALGYPLERTPLYGFLHTLLTTVATMKNGRFLATQYIRFLLHPYIKNIRFGNRTDVTRILVHTLEEYLAENTALSSFTLADIETTTEIFQRCANILRETEFSDTVESLQEHLRTIHGNTLGKILNLQDGATLGALATNLLNVVSYIHDSSTARLHPFFNEYVEKLFEALETLRTSLAAEHTFSDVGEYLRFLRHYLAAHTVPFRGTPLQGLQVLGLLETRNIKFRTVYLMDANEGILPPSLTPTLIPQQIRKQLGLETYRQREKLIEHFVKLLLQGAERVHIFFAESSGGKRERSRYVQKLIWQIEREAQRLQEAEIVQTVRYKVHLGTSLPSPVEKSGAALKILNTFTFTATNLDTYLRCPLRFYYEYVLRLREKDSVSDDVEAQDIGALVHKILQRIFEPYVGTVLRPEMFQESVVEHIIDETLRQHFGVTIRGRALLLQRQIKKRMLDFVKHYQIPLTKSSTIELLGVEEQATVWQYGALFFARFDRIERRNGKIVVLDYKTAAEEKNYTINFKKLDPHDRSTWNKALGSLQLPLYILLYSTLRSLPATEITAGYLMLGKKALTPEIEIPLYGDEKECVEWHPRLEEIVQSIVAEIRSASTPFLPTSDIGKHCPTCPMNVLCGTQWTAR